MKRGYTLVETIVVLAITVVALIALVNLFLIFNSVYGYQSVYIATAGSAGSAMNAFEASILPADHVLPSHTFSGVTYTSATTTLVLELPSVDSTGNIIFTSKDYVVFYTVASTTLYRLVAADAQSIRRSGRTQLSSTVNSLSFTYDNIDFTKVTKVTADLQTRASYKNQTVQSHLIEGLYLRNLVPPL